MATENFQINPFHGDFNPGTVHGQKIFEQKTKGLPENERLTLTKKDGPNFRRLVESKSGEFGKCVTSIPIEIDNAGVTVKTASILKDYALISLERCQRQAHNRYSTALAETDPICTDAWKTRNIDPATNNDDKKSFYDQVHSQVVAEWLRNVLTSEDYEKLMRKKKHFTFTDDTTGVEAYDGPIMLLLTFRLVEPNTIVGVETLRAKLEKLRMHMVNNDVNQACDEIERLHRRIEQKGKSCESILRYTIKTLMLGPHDGFTRYISRFNDAYKDMKQTDIIASARVKWNNMVEQGMKK